MSICRLLEDLDTDVQTRPILIYCDNTQTIRLLTEEIAKLTTKLRQVDIHHRWLRQEVSCVEIVKYIQSSDMIADGFTKVLPLNKWKQFLKQINL
jgi:hypothetical protein